jgi:uncharacterized protein YciI
MNRYRVMLVRRPVLDPAVVPLHAAYLNGLRERGQLDLSGQFSDGTGGAYQLQAADLAEATALVHDDPAYLGGGWNITVYEWQAH